MSSTAEKRPARSLKSRLWTAARLVLGLAILYFVAKSLPWTDNLTYQAADEKGSLEGQIETDWKADRVHFRATTEQAMTRRR